MEKRSDVSRTFAENSATFAELCARTGPQKKCAGNVLTGDVVAALEVEAREVHKALERAEVA